MKKARPVTVRVEVAGCTADEMIDEAVRRAASFFDCDPRDVTMASDFVAEPESEVRLQSGEAVRVTYRAEVEFTRG